MDIVNVIIFKPEDISYYNKYTFIQIFLMVIIIFLVVIIISSVISLSPTVPSTHMVVSYSYSLIINFMSIIIAALFIHFWVKIKKIETSFKSILCLTSFVSIIDILLGPIGLLIILFESKFLYSFVVIAAILSIAIAVVAFSKSTGLSKRFIFLGVILGTVFIKFLASLVMTLFFTTEIIPVV